MNAQHHMVDDARSSSRQYALIGLTAVFAAATLANPVYPRAQWLQHAPTLPALAAAVVAARRRWFSDAAMAAGLAFLALHALAARWIYSYVPYEQWCDVVLGSGPAEWFGWRRNQFDRLVHVAFGALLTPGLRDVAVRHGLSPRAALAAAWLAVAGGSAAYEVFEWLLAITAAPETAERYNGQQGDPWDAQKDMALAMAGSAAACVWFMRPCRFRSNKRR